MSWSDVVAILVAVALVALAAVLFRSRSALPWRTICLAVLAAGVLVTIGGNTDTNGSGPNAPTVVGCLVGLVSVVSAVLALVPGNPERSRASRLPLMIACGALVLAAVGFVSVAIIT